MKFNKVMITLRSSGREDGWATPFQVHKFDASTEEELNAILELDFIKNWEYGYSVGYSNL
jgi:hypothetical protein